jgi:hypothetical protein
VRSSTLPDLACLDVDARPPELPLPDPLPAPLPAVVLGAEDPFDDADFLLADEDRFLEAPHVDMTSYTVPRGCHTQR